MNLIIQILYRFAIVSLVVLLLSQTLGQYYWVFELFAHFVPHYTFLLGLSLAVFAFRARNKHKTHQHKTHHTQTIALSLMTVLISLFFWCLTPINSHQVNNPINIAYHNININNPDFKNAYQKLSEHHPNLMVLIEPNPDDLKATLKHNNSYQLLCEHLEYSPFSMAILIGNGVNATCEVFELTGFPMAKINIKNKILYAIHPPPPINSVMAARRDEYLTQLSQLIQKEQVQKEQGAVMVIGDMNASAFSPVYRAFISDSRLNAVTANALPTWLPLGIGIDHILIKHSKAMATPMGWHNSDHRAFLVGWE